MSSAEGAPDAPLSSSPERESSDSRFAGGPLSAAAEGGGTGTGGSTLAGSGGEAAAVVAELEA